MNDIKRFKSRFAAVAAIAAASGFGATAAQAQATADLNVSATLDNALTITENAPLNFGTIAVVEDSADTVPVGFTLSALGAFVQDSASPTTAAVQLAPGTVGDVSIDTGVPSFINLTVTVGTSGTLTAAGAPPGTSALTLDIDEATEIVAAAGTITTACTAADPTICAVQTDGTGLFRFNVGGSLAETTVASALQATATTYSGTVPITANFR